MVRILQLLFITGLIFSCQEGENKDPNVIVNTKGIYNGISFTLNGQSVGESYDLGEYVTADPPIILDIKITNNTAFPMTNLDFSYPGQTSKIFGFYSSTGDEGVFPGEGGSCGKVLLSKKDCNVKISFYATKSGTYEQEGRFTYNNLVEDDSKTIKFKVVAGQPASLIFDDGNTSRFIFGSRVGASKKPVLERADVIEYHRQLKIQNMGELSARDIDISKLISCSSLKTGNCPAGYEDPWRLEHNCPDTLAPLESCHADMYFIPLNQDPTSGFDAELEEIYYKGEISVEYDSTPMGKKSTLSGVFETNSTTIRARFTSSKGNILFPDPIVTGNYIIDIFKIQNNGYRPGEIRKFIFEKGDSGFINPAANKAYCVKTLDSTSLLKCYSDEALTSELSLEEFPFVLTDRNNCLRATSEEIYLVEIDGGCVFDIRFQPSVKYLSAYKFDYDFYIDYDAKWKGLETIYVDKLFNIKSESVQAAKIELSSVKFDGANVELKEEIAALNLASHVDLGRLALLSPGYEQWRKISFTFHNIGGVPIKNFKSFIGVDGGTISKTEIPRSSDSVGISVGPYATKYFKDIVLDMNNCGNGVEISPDPENDGITTSFCTVTMEFAPIGMATNAEEDETMFDYLATNPKLRVFHFKYHDGSNFSDENIETTIADSANNDLTNWKETSSGLTAQLVKKGYLKDYSTLASNFGKVISGNEAYINFIFTNIGTGPISYIPYKGANLDFETNLKYDDGFQRVEVSNPLSYGANYDCNDVFDFNYSSTDSVATIESRLASLQTLNKLESCVLRVRIKATNKFFFASFNNKGDVLNYVMSREHNNTLNMYFQNPGMIQKQLRVDFYDGDIAGQASSSDPMRQTFGDYFETGASGSHLKSVLTIRGNVDAPSKLGIGSPHPYMSAVIYRPGIFYPSFNFQNDNGDTKTRNNSTIDPTYFAYDNNVPGSSTCLYFTSCEAHLYANGLGIDSSSVDYVFYAGTFPTNSEATLGFDLANAGVFSTRLKTQQLTGDNVFTLTSTYNNEWLNRAVVSTSGLISGGVKINFSLDTSTPGLFSSDYKVTYNTGVDDNPEDELIVKLVAEVMDAVPTLAIDSQNYVVEPNPGSTPDEELDTAIESHVLGFNHKGSDPKVIIEAVQVKERNSESSYAKKRVTIKNTSIYPMTDFNVMFKESPIDKSPSSKISWNSASDFAIKVTEETCTTYSTLPANESCYIDIWYQPNENDAETLINLSILYDTASNRHQFVQQNLTLNFLPKAPSVVKVASTPEQNVEYRKRGGDSTIYSAKASVINFGNLVYNQVNKTFTFTKTLQNNNEETRASLLKQYEEFHNLGNSNYGPMDISFDGTVDGQGGYKIYKTGPMTVYANSVCLFGSTDVSTLPNKEKGFNADSPTDCRIKIIYAPGLNSVGRKFLFSNVNDVSELYIPLKYYNNNRSSSDELLITFTGKVYPEKAILNATPAYYDVATYSNGTIVLNWESMNAATPSLGEVVGYRVYYTRFPGELGDELAMQTSSSDYIDVIGENTTTLYVDSSPTAYYIYVAAIRSSSDYTATGVYAGLAPGEYLSHSSISTLKVVIPPADMYFDFERNMLVTYTNAHGGYSRCSKPECSQGYYKYFEAIAACQALNPVYISDKGISKAKYLSLINEAAWDSIASNMSMNSSYSEIEITAHWLKTDLVYNIDTVFQNHPLYDELETSQRFTDVRKAYLRPTMSQCDDYGTCNVAMAKGGFLNDPNYESYIGPDYSIAMARCYIPLD